MRTYIKIDSLLREQMLSLFNVSHNSLYEYLHGLTNSQLGKDVRAYALAHGGQMVCETYMPACTTVKTSTGLAQTFENGIVVLLDLGDSTARIMRNDQELARYDHVTLDSWANILWMAQTWDLDKLES